MQVTDDKPTITLTFRNEIVTDTLREFVEKKIKPDRLGILIPAFWKIKSGSMEKVKDVSIQNSGVDNRFLLFARS